MVAKTFLVATLAMSLVLFASSSRADEARVIKLGYMPKVL